jgi:N-acetylglucosamine kinase-like BadF-type ATPase
MNETRSSASCVAPSGEVGSGVLHVPRAVLAVDSGGSKCEALLASDDGTALRYARAEEPGRGGRDGGVIDRVVRAVREGVAANEIVQAGIVKGVVWGRERRGYCAVGEDEGPMALAGVTFGLVALAGTGARVFGRTRAGRELVLDALGPALGDAGSGYQVGRMAMRAAARAAMHPRHATSLRARVFDACCGPSPDPDNDDLISELQTVPPARRRMPRISWGPRLAQMVHFSLRPHDRSVLAALARIVDEEARRGDAVAVAILRSAADELAEVVYDVVDRLGMAGEPYPLVGTGSVAAKSDIYWDELCRRVREFAPFVEPVRPRQAPVVGVALVALRHMDGTNSAAVRERLLTTAEEVIRRDSN